MKNSAFYAKSQNLPFFVKEFVEEYFIKNVLKPLILKE